MQFLYSTLVLAAAFTVDAQKCPVKLDGRLAANSTPATFDDTSASPFNSKFVFGQNLTWSNIIKIPGPEVGSSLFDAQKGTIPFEVTISDASIFSPNPAVKQTGFRRAELLHVNNTGTDDSTLGLKTVHVSLRKDTARPLNQSHEYQMVFMENSATNQFRIQTGVQAGFPEIDQDSLVVQSNGQNLSNLFVTAFTEGWHNFAFTLDFDKNTTQVLYSNGTNPLATITDAVQNDVSGQGQYHFGILKKSTGVVKDASVDGFQEAGIDEGIVYGGIFVEDSVDGCVSLTA